MHTAISMRFGTPDPSSPHAVCGAVDGPRAAANMEVIDR